MHLYVVRHGIAEDSAPEGDDTARALTDEGEKKFKRSVKGLRELDCSVSRVLTSPWTRARQTADLLSPILDGEVIVTDLLCTTPRPELYAMIAESGTSIAVVGHEPWLSELVASLAFGDARHGEAIELKKGGVIWLDGTVVPGGMTIRAVMPPKLLRSLA